MKSNVCFHRFYETLKLKPFLILVWNFQNPSISYPIGTSWYTSIACFGLVENDILTFQKSRKSDLIQTISKMIFKSNGEDFFMQFVRTWKSLKIQQRIIFLVPILLMSSLFSSQLGIGAFLLTAMACLATLVFLLIEQSSQIYSLQTTLYQVCTTALLEYLRANHLDTGDSGVENMAE